MNLHTEPPCSRRHGCGVQSAEACAKPRPLESEAQTAKILVMHDEGTGGRPNCGLASPLHIKKPHTNARARRTHAQNRDREKPERAQQGEDLQRGATAV